MDPINSLKQQQPTATQIASPLTSRKTPSQPSSPQDSYAPTQPGVHREISLQTLRNLFHSDEKKLDADTRSTDDDSKKQETSESPSAAREFFKGLVGGILGHGGGMPWTILTSNDTEQGKKDEANGIFGIFRQGKTGTSSETARQMMKDMDPGP